MGTRATIHIYEGKKHIVSIYRQMDGYPSGIGLEIVNHLRTSRLVNGYGNGDSAPNVFNGMQCLAAYLIGVLKLFPYGQHRDAIGNVYLTDESDRQEWNYKVFTKGDKLLLEVEHDDKIKFSGEMYKFDAKKIEGDE